MMASNPESTPRGVIWKGTGEEPWTGRHGGSGFTTVSTRRTSGSSFAAVSASILRFGAPCCRFRPTTGTRSSSTAPSSGRDPAGPSLEPIPTTHWTSSPTFEWGRTFLSSSPPVSASTPIRAFACVLERSCSWTWRRKSARSASLPIVGSRRSVTPALQERTSE